MKTIHRFWLRSLIVCLLVLAIQPVPVLGALASGITWEVEHGSSNNNGASFNPLVTGFPTDGAATSATGASPVFSSASYNFVSGDVGAWVFIKGTNWLPGFYQVASVASNQATLTAGSGAGIAYPNYAATTVAGIASTASPTGATWGIDYSQQASAQFAFTDMVTATTTFTSAAHPVGVNFIGNGIQIISGSGCTASFYTVVSTSGTTATIDRTGGTGTCTSNLGGAVGTVAELNTAMNTTSNISQVGFVKANATYQISGGITFNPTITGKGTLGAVNGYTTLRGDNGFATIQATAGSFTLVNISNNNSLSNFTFRNFILDCNSQSTSTGFNITANGNAGANLHAENCTGGYGINLANASAAMMCRNCWVSNYTGSSFAIAIGYNSNASTTFCIYCFATGGTGSGIEIVPSGQCIYCIAANNTGGTTDGFLVTCNNQANALVINSIAYSNGRDGIRYTGDSCSGNLVFVVTNTILYGNTGYGFDNTGTTGTSTSYGVIEDFNAYGSNTAGATNNQLQGGHDKALTADPFTNGASLNFLPNNTSGGGTVLQGAGFPGTLITGGTGNLDIGTLQHAIAASSSAFGYVQ